MLDKLRELIICKEDIYYIVVPLFIFIVPLIKNTFSKIKENTNFKFIHKEKSSFEKYYRMQLKIMFLTYFFVYVLYIIILFCLFAIMPNRYSKQITEYYKCIYLFVCIATYGILIYFLKKIKKENIVKLKYQVKKNIWNDIIFYVPIIVQAFILLSSVIFRNNTIIKTTETIIFYIFMFGSTLVLDKKSDFKYKYVYLTLDNDIKTGAIPCENIKKEGNWIIVSTKEKGETHYKLKDIKVFEYTDRLYIKI